MPTEVETVAPAESTPALEVETVETQPGAQADSPQHGGTDDSPPSPADDDRKAFDAAMAEAKGEKPLTDAAEITEEPAPLETDEPKEPKTEEAKADDLSQSESEKPFKDRAEWQELSKLADSLGKEKGAAVRKTMRTLFEREAGLAKAVEQSKPAVDVAMELYRAAGSDQTAFTNMRAFIKTFTNDPANAVAMCEKLLIDAKTRAGLVIQSPDLLTEVQKLDQQVKDGEVTPEQAAKRKQELTELESSRATLKRKTAETDQQRQAREQEQQNQRIEQSKVETYNAEKSFLEATAKADPDYKVVYPLYAKLAQLAGREFLDTNRRLPNAAETKTICEKSFREAKAELARVRPRRQAAAPVRDTGSSRDTRHQPVTELEQFRADLAAAKKNHN
jgi:hypothetical protein